MGRAGAADIAQLVECSKGMQEASSLIPNPNPVPPKSGHVLYESGRWRGGNQKFKVILDEISSLKLPCLHVILSHICS